MDINPELKTFNILPVFAVNKVINPLSEAAKKSFDSHWDYYYTFTIAWLKWKIEF